MLETFQMMLQFEKKKQGEHNLYSKETPKRKKEHELNLNKEKNCSMEMNLRKNSFQEWYYRMMVSVLTMRKSGQIENLKSTKCCRRQSSFGRTTYLRGFIPNLFNLVDHPRKLL